MRHPAPAHHEPSFDDAHPRLRVRSVIWRTITTYRDLGMTDHAAALTYYAMLSLFPSLLTGVALLSLVGEQDLAARAGAYLIDHGADSDTASVVRATLQRMIDTSQSAASVTLFFASLLAINGASGAFAAAGRALNTVNGVDDSRGFVRRKLVDLLMSAVIITLFAVTVIAVFLGGTIADDLLRTIGFSGTLTDIWRYARLPIAVGSAMLAASLIFAFAPAGERKQIRWVSHGAITGVGIWIIVSVGFAYYLQHFSSYGAAYGAFGAAIVLLLWLYISANAFLFGAALNVTIDRMRIAGHGGPPAMTPPPSTDRPSGAHDR